MAGPKWVICKFCDSAYQRCALERRHVARCSQCGADLYHERYATPDVMLAVALAGLFAFVVANVFPIAMLDVQGRRSEATLWQAVIASLDSGAAPIGAVAALAVFIFPLAQLCLFVYVLIPLRASKLAPGFTVSMHILRQMHPWVMVEVFMLGVLVAIVKLGDVAIVTPLTGTWGFAGLTVLMTLLNACSLEEIWNRASAIEEQQEEEEQQARERLEASPEPGAGETA